MGAKLILELGKEGWTGVRVPTGEPGFSPLHPYASVPALFPQQPLGARWGSPNTSRLLGRPGVGGLRGRCWAHTGMLRHLVGLPLVPPSLLVPSQWTLLPSGQCEGPAGAGRDLGWGRQKVHKSLSAKTSALSRGVEAAAHGSGQGINHNSPTIDPFAAAIRKTVLVLSIF